MAKFVYRFRYLIIAAFVLFTLAAALFIPNLRFEGDIQALAPTNVSSVKEYKSVSQTFGGADSLAFSAQSAQLFTPRALSEAATIAKELQSLPDVSDVVSVFTYVEPVNTEDGLSFIPFIDPEMLPQDQDSANALKMRLSGIATVSGKLLSADGDTLLYIIQAAPNVPRTRMIEGIQAIMKAHQDFSFHMAGTSFIDYQMVSYMKHDVVVLVVFGLAAVLLVLTAGFRSMRGILLPLVTIGSSLIITFGFMGLLHAKLTIVALIIPVMLIAICNNYAIHFLTRFYEDVFVNGMTDKVQIIDSSFKSLSKPVWLAFLTTVASFISFVTSPIPRIAEMGLFVAFGIAFAFVMTMFFIPALLSVFPPPKKHRNYHVNEALISKISQKAGGAITKHRLAILALTLVLAITGIVVIPRIVVDSELANYFNPKDPVRQGIDFINSKVAGSQLIKVSMPLDPRTAEGLAKGRQFQDYAESLNAVGSVFSIVDSIQTLNRVFQDNDPAFDTVPDNDETAAQLLLLVETSLSPERLVQLVSEDYQNLCFSIQLKAVDSATLQKTADLLRAKAHEIAGPQDVAIAGVSLISNQLNRLVIISMLQSFAIAFVLIFAFVSFGFKNIPAGLASASIMIAIVLVVFGFMEAAKIELSTATALVASITLGVGIDYLIHFSARWFAERSSGKSLKEATSRTLSLTGRGIIINAMAIVFAVVPPFFSQFRPIMYFGLLCFMSIILSLAGGLVVMPALLSAVPEKYFKRVKVG
jgi:hypothetical protein